MSFIQFPPPDKPPRGFALLELGFRPFFLGAGLAGCLLMLVWLMFLGKGFIDIHYYSPSAWHGHEMMFGYAVAVIVGFLLTAVRNWTQVDTIKHGGLALLFATWLLGRLAPFLPLPAPLIAGIDLAFLPLATVLVSWPIIKSRAFAHLIFLPILLLMTTANLLFHASMGSYIDIPHLASLDLMRWLLVLLLTLMGGRVIPFFIEKGHPHSHACRNDKIVETLLIPVLVLAIASHYLHFSTVLTAGLFAAASLLQWIRILGWHQSALWRVPMLWILFIGYAWIPIGLGLIAIAQFGTVTESTAHHALMAGALGSITIGMMARVTRGHTGRSIDANPATIAIFVLMLLSALVRILGAGAIPWSWHLSGGLWIIAMGLFTVTHLDYWWQPRVDGLPG